MASVIDILINASWRGGGAVNRASADLRELDNNAAASSTEMAAAAESSQVLDQGLEGVGEQAPKASLGLGTVAAAAGAALAAFYALQRGASAAYDALKEGANIELVERRFDRLAATIGTTGEALRADIGIASRGLISDLDAVSLGTDLLALGLAKSHDEAVRLASASAQLGFDLNELVLTLTNQTMRRFDQLGVSVDGFTEKVDALEAAGLSAEDAFQLAFIEQAEDQIRRVGSVAETTAGQISQIEAAWADVKNEFKEDVIGGAGGIIDNIASGIAAVRDAEAAIVEIESARRAVAFEQVDAIEQQQAAVDSLRDALRTLRGDEERPFITAQDADRVARFAAQLAAAGETAEEQRQILQDFGFEIGQSLLGTTVSIEGFATSWGAVEDAIHELRVNEIAPFIQRDGPEMVAQMQAFTKESQGAADEGVGALVEELDALIEDFRTVDAGEFLEGAGVSIETFANLTDQLGGTAEAVEYLKLVQQDAGQVTDDLTVSAEELNDALEAQQERLQGRAQAFLDFQTDLTDISVREGERREQAEADYEERRSEIVERYGQQRAQSEEDYQRRRARAEAAYQDDISDVQEDSAERQAELRERANERLADLERDHLQRMQDIIEDADIQLSEAAGRLDAAAVVAIQRQRERALEDEQQSFEDSRDEIQRTLDRQLEAEQEAAAERLASLQEYHEERKRIEDEDRAIRLAREQEAHDARLTQLDDQHQERLDQIRDEGAEEAIARGEQFADLWTGIEEIGEERIPIILEQAQRWYDEWIALISGAGSVGISASDESQEATDLIQGLFGTISDESQVAADSVEGAFGSIDVGGLFGVISDESQDTADLVEDAFSSIDTSEISSSIDALNDYYAEQARLEEGAQSDRLRRAQAAHDEILEQGETQQRERLGQIQAQGDEQIDQYETFGAERQDIEQEWMDSILKAEEDWWQRRRDLIPGLGGDGQQPSSVGQIVGPNVTNLPDQFFQTTGGNTIQGDINININGAGSPEETGDAVANRLLDIFETFNK